MKSKLFLMLLICKVNVIVCDTGYHYISQVSETTPQTLAPKPLFSPHDPRREGLRARGVYSYQTGIDKNYRYGTQHQPGVNTGINVLHDDASSVFGGDQRLWYPVYADVHYPGWLGVAPTTYEMSYGSLPQGYEPQVPLRGDPLGYSYSYSAGDHSRSMTSDGRGNFYSSFSFVPPAGSAGVQPSNVLPLDYGLQSGDHRPSSEGYGISPTRSPSFANIPPVNPHVPVYSTVSPIPRRYNPSTARPVYPVTSSSAIRPVYTTHPSLRTPGVTTARPFINPLLPNPVNDFTNGFNFVAQNYPSRRIPENSFNINSHALSTNIQHNSQSGESSAKQNVLPSGSRRVTIIPPDQSTISSKVTTDRSYQALSRSLPLAFSSQRLTTISPSSISLTHPTDRAWSSPPSRRYLTDRSRSSVQTIRSTTRRSTTERSIPYADFRRSTTERSIPYTNFRRLSTERSATYAASRRSTTIIPPPSSTKASVVQKIPRKLKYINITKVSDDSLRPNFIDDLTSLAYSADNVSLKNSSIIQIKQRRDKSYLLKLPDSAEKTSVLKKSPILGAYLNNSSGTNDSISKDGHVTGNKTYLAGLGLRTNIHY